MQLQIHNQLPPLRQSLSDSSLRSNDPGAAASINNDTPANSTTSSSRADSNASLLDLPSSLYRHDQRPPPHSHPNQQYPPVILPLPGTSSNGIDQSFRGNHSHPQHPHIAPSFSPRAHSPRSQQHDMMYPNYNQQYAQPSQQYGGMPQHQGRMLPSAHASMLPPVYGQNNYQPSLPGPINFDTSGAQQMPTPASTTHTLASSSAQIGADYVYQGTRGNYRYELRVDQQPQRARMCGFGDKDRRPITPPPCVRLVVKRLDTDEEVDVDRLDGAFYILQVDLWSAEGTSDVNIIRANSTAPSQSISTAVQMAYPPPNTPMYLDNMGQQYGVNSYGMPNYVMPQPQSVSHAMFTRNLIGSLTVNASLLKDTEGNPGYWFVLSDLSVRTEGWFRLRMTFIDVGVQNGGETVLNRQRCPILATVFSDKFQVYSAKKFPGVIESTPLSKCFAHQGIKIPIRKDGKGDKNDDDE